MPATKAKEEKELQPRTKKGHRSWDRVCVEQLDERKLLKKIKLDEIEPKELNKAIGNFFTVLRCARLDDPKSSQFGTIQGWYPPDQKYIAELLGVSQSSYGRLENGDRKMSLPEFMTYCKARDLDVQVVWAEMLKHIDLFINKRIRFHQSMW